MVALLLVSVKLKEFILFFSLPALPLMVAFGKPTTQLSTFGSSNPKADTPDAVRELDDKEAIAKLNDEEIAGYDFVKARKKISRKEYENYFGYNYRKAHRHLTKMKELGLIGDNGERINSPNFKYVFKE